jgi:hypothetical protein
MQAEPNKALEAHIISLEQSIKALERSVKALEQGDKEKTAIINGLIKRLTKAPPEALQFNLEKELKARGLTTDPAEIKRIEDIVKQYPKLKPEQICGLLDKTATMNQKETIRNLPGYLNNAFRKTYTFYHKDYAGMDI